MSRSSNTEKPRQSDSRANKSVFRFLWHRRSENKSEAQSPAKSLENTLVPVNPVFVPKSRISGKKQSNDKATVPVDVSPVSADTAAKLGRGHPLRKSSLQAASGQAGKERDKLVQGIEKLNRSVIQLYKTTGLLRGDIKPEDWDKEPSLKLLDVQTLSEGIQQVATITQQLIAEHKRAKDGRKAQKGLLATTERFLKTTGFIISPALKSFLTVMVQSAAVILILFHLINCLDTTPEPLRNIMQRTDSADHGETHDQRI